MPGWITPAMILAGNTYRRTFQLDKLMAALVASISAANEDFWRGYPPGDEILSLPSPPRHGRSLLHTVLRCSAMY